MQITDDRELLNEKPLVPRDSVRVDGERGAWSRRRWRVRPIEVVRGWGPAKNRRPSNRQD